MLKDIPEKKLKKGDLATIVEHLPSDTSEDAYSLEVFNALGDTRAVVTVSESEIETLTESEVLILTDVEIRPFAQSEILHMRKSKSLAP